MGLGCGGNISGVFLYYEARIELFCKEHIPLGLFTIFIILRFNMLHQFTPHLFPLAVGCIQRCIAGQKCQTLLTFTDIPPKDASRIAWLQFILSHTHCFGVHIYHNIIYFASYCIVAELVLTCLMPVAKLYKENYKFHNMFYGLLV